jgi:nitroreductase
MTVVAEYQSKQIKQAHPDYPIHPLLEQRWSPRAFDARPVEPEKLRSIFEAARWSASGGNTQPWYFVAGTQDNSEAFAKLAGSLNPTNAEWAAKAPVLVLTVARVVMENGRIHTHALHDVGLATQNLMLQATALDLYVHPMAGYSAEKAREALGIPEGYEPVTLLAIGYLGDPDSLPENRRQQELTARARRPLADFVFEGAWGEPAPFVQPAIGK